MDFAFERVELEVLNTNKVRKTKKKKNVNIVSDDLGMKIKR